jgi:ankyrin repeat protein
VVRDEPSLDLVPQRGLRILGATSGPIIATDAFFIAAAHLGDIQLLEALLATGTVNPNYLLRATPGSLHGMSALWEAIDFGPEAVVEWLIQRGGVTRFDVIDRQHNNLYHRALRWNHPNSELTLRYLLDHFDPDELISPNTDKVTPLEMAIGTQPYEIIYLLLSRIPPIGNRLLRREDFSYPLSVCLCTAARRNRLDVLQLLVQWMDANGILLRLELPPLFTALQSRRHEIALWLIEQDISLDISFNNVRPISAAAAVGFNDIVQILLAKGVPANSADPEDRSALVAALMVGNLSAAELLLDTGADTNVHIDGDEQSTEKGKETLLLWAAARNHPDTVRFLLERGWDVNGNYVGFGTPPLDTQRRITAWTACASSSSSARTSNTATSTASPRYITPPGAGTRKPSRSSSTQARTQTPSTRTVTPRSSARPRNPTR